jgi:hypothetical protein
MNDRMSDIADACGMDEACGMSEAQCFVLGLRLFRAFHVCLIASWVKLGGCMRRYMRV